MQAYRTHSRRLRVLFVMPPCLPTPPKGYGGIEVVAAALLPELEAAGARITLITPEGSTVQVSAKHELTEPIYPILSHTYHEVSTKVEEYVARVMKLAQSGDYDIIHDFSGLLAMINTLASPLRDRSYPPVIHTIHGPLEPFYGFYTELLRQHRRLTYTAISQAQIAAAPTVIKRRSSVIYNCLNPDDYLVGPGGQRLLVLGRLCHDKGQDRLVEYCAPAGYELDVAGTVAEIGLPDDIEAEAANGSTSAVATNPDFQLYLRIRQHIDGWQIAFHGNVSGQFKQNLLGGSRALVIPNRWAEPFGMVAIEAMATGTPVVAMATGAMPELIEHGVTGYLANSFEELCEYLKPEHTARLDRAACRQSVAARFSSRSLAKEWLSLYHSLSNRHLGAPLATTAFRTRPVPAR